MVTCASLLCYCACDNLVNNSKKGELSELLDSNTVNGPEVSISYGHLTVVLGCTISSLVPIQYQVVCSTHQRRNRRS
jgi:hypothetical protein